MLICFGVLCMVACVYQLILASFVSFEFQNLFTKLAQPFISYRVFSLFFLQATLK
eukprot:c55374_g1_i1 orf=179-343(+)